MFIVYSCPVIYKPLLDTYIFKESLYRLNLELLFIVMDVLLCNCTVLLILQVNYLVRGY